MLMKRSLFLCAGVLSFALAAPASAACYNPNADRDKFLAGMVDWVPARGAKAEWEGKTYNRAQAVRFAKARISKGYSDRGGNAKESAAAVAAFAVIDGKGINTKAAKKYARAKLKVKFEDAVACWAGYLK